jgi:hypothetical protein
MKGKKGRPTGGARVPKRPPSRSRTKDDDQPKPNYPSSRGRRSKK